MQELQIFRNSEFGELGILEIEGKPYFPAIKCAKVLGYEDAKKAVKQHCKDPGVVFRPLGVQTGTKRDGTPAYQTVNQKLINEGNLYRLITHSKLPSAERFETWVFDEVLPAIRKTGAYGASGTSTADLTAVITQTATIVCAEMAKQRLPLFQAMVQPHQAGAVRTVDYRHKRKRRSIGKIDRLPLDLKETVERRLLSGDTYKEISEFLESEGHKVSQMAVHNHEKAEHFRHFPEIEEMCRKTKAAFPNCAKYRNRAGGLVFGV